ncbi:MAG: hypothetical protein HGA85_02505 [Nanoarchaeota archaeon]|nr:hypothetical protein [Nanoarchaeota archaeon]
MNITKLVWAYIAERPSIRDCMKKGLVNHSELARQICEHHKMDKFDACLIACRRYAEKEAPKIDNENSIRDLMKTSKLRVRNKIMVAIIEKPRDMESVLVFEKNIRKKRGDINIIEGEDVVTVITNETYSDEVKEYFKSRVIRVTKGLAQVNMVFDERIESTSGVVSHVYSLLSEYGINILEEMSCWTDLMLIIDEKDLAKSVNCLSQTS